MLRALLAILFLTASACVPRASVPEGERQRVSRAFEGQRRWLRVAAYVGPFFGDRTKALLSDAPVAELDLLETTEGKPIPPPPPERIVPPGTAVRVQKIEFPTGWLIANRIVMTPRYHPWVYLEIPGEDRPAILVLSQTAASLEDVRAEVDRVLAGDDPRPMFEALPEAQRQAILRKQPAEGMNRRALAMAWGYPEKERIDRPAGTEEWIWAGGRRRAFLQEEKLVRWEPR